MLRVTKNDDKLEIKNVICFFVGNDIPSLDAKKIKKTKEEDWSYQDYLTVACDELKYNLTWLNKETVQFTFAHDVININDELMDVHISLNKDNVHDTVIFQGQANDEPGVNYEGLLRAFEYMEFYMINTFDEISLASDKMLSSNILSSQNIPQPKYLLVTKAIMQDPEHNDNTRESFWKLLNSIYDNNVSINAEKKDTQYVVKILGGSLGIGVCICNRSEIESILQAIFALDEERELIIQEYKENTGDIRAHAFSVDGKHYEILAVMKRNKISGDFRSNVSLGATTQEIELTDEQKDIILNTAKLSGCRWVGVDLMACSDGSNVVIEYNSSPGVQGISQQIKKNMFKVVLTKISEYFKKNKDNDSEKYSHRADIVTYYSEYSPKVIEELQENIWNNLSTERMAIMTKCLSFKPGMQYTLHGKEPLYGFDCSGYVYWVIKEATGADVPKMCIDYFDIRKNSQWEEIKKEELQPGDIGILNDSNQFNHCGIYAGDDKWFETNHAYGVQLSNFNGFKFFFRLKNI